jgi:anti-sigma regulatory factor (Ser/Thr protein kinase)
VRGLLAGTPRAADVELIASELIANSIRHTPAGEKGGKFTITISGGSGWSRVEVSDAGTGQWSLPAADSQPDDDAEYGRGLAIAGAFLPGRR